MSQNFIKIEDDYKGYSTDIFCVPKHYEDDVDSVMLPFGLIHDRIERLARDIFTDLWSEPIVVLCVLKGGYRFFADLSDQIQLLCRHSEKSMKMHFQFIGLKSYLNTQSTGVVSVQCDKSVLDDLAGKNVLIVEDIIDSGTTMVRLVKLINEQKPKNVRVASLLVKRAANSCGYRPDYCGFEIPDRFVVGYALDYNEHFRDMNHICVINKTGIQKYAK
jgi:hypoxanthine phosphoribosyltransferase